MCHINYWEHDESEPEDDTYFACACGDATCKGRGDDPANINLFGSWYAADCVMANNHPVVIEMRERDHVNERRR